MPLQIFRQRDFQYRLVRHALAGPIFVIGHEPPQASVLFIVKARTDSARDQDQFP